MVGSNQPGNQLTPKHALGFKTRMSDLLTLAGLPEYGRLTMIARWAGMSVPGVSKMFEDGRPPKQLRSFDAIVDGLCEQLSHTRNEEVCTEQMSRYLLMGGQDPFGVNHVAEESGEYHVLMSRFDALFLGKIFVTMDKVGQEEKVDIFTDLGDAGYNELVECVLSYCKDCQVDFSDPEFHLLIRGAVLMAKAGCLEHFELKKPT
ncbi:MAG: hypothetical protein COA42_22435 [Alteromonadaceae bacterium]|nr:MAG: hypothetical protein COA42_22435 [Alteromonadaceae bacterium]